MNLIEKYKRDHQHPVNKATHAIGIPLIVVSLPLFFWRWDVALALFVVGWLFQLVGHVFEGKAPSFFSNPLYLLVGPWWLVKKLLEVIRGPSTPPRRQ